MIFAGCRQGCNEDGAGVKSRPLAIPPSDDKRAALRVTGGAVTSAHGGGSDPGHESFSRSGRYPRGRTFTQRKIS
jgi:hypothetical protein